MKKTFHMITALALVALAAMAPIAPAKAALITNNDMTASAEMAEKRSAVEAFVARQDVQSQMAKLGVDPQEAQDRVAAMSDAQVEMAYQKIDTMPAGGSALGAVVGAAVFIFLVLLITDLLGLTSVFSFTHPAR